MKERTFHWARLGEIAKMVRAVDDMELLCRPCNAVHYQEALW